MVFPGIGKRNVHFSKHWKNKSEIFQGMESLRSLWSFVAINLPMSGTPSPTPACGHPSV
jgi:hypothetical protein